MTGDIGAAADIATGSFVGRAFEPSAGEAHGVRTGHGPDGALCLNCGTRLLGEHCHACGQSAHVHRSLGGIGHEIAHGVFHFEGKIWRTLPLLVLHPGALTRRYVNGERARFVSPLALFLFTVFLMFATIGAVGGEMTKDFIRDQRTGKTSDYAREAARARLALTKVEAQQEVAKREPANLSGEQLATLDRQASALRTTVRALGVAADMQNGAAYGTVVDLGDFKTGWERLDHGIAKANGNPGLMFYKLQTSAYKYSWGLIPLSVPFMALLFVWRRRHHLYDHAIFVTYSLAFMMLLTIVLIIAGVIGVAEGWIVMAAMCVPPVHMFAQLRGAYELRKWSAAWRTVALLTFAFTVLLAFIVLLLLHGLTD
ncbi:DUF3667 domain-containing protein [Sphingomonas sp. CFBP 13728]|uniref:DUF3667 domain-containing protein n=1 Tax=Sphingomonas sp. CFBP 13728 TaxID=2775294 RepID=UPI00177B7D4B|nr:DUF3667 domain-containing protein [Sphingomonas sp. CFBP 13728]MBD8619139.1 DUF3667 domain-containing protein [Sphingomonas sp. CFBP 13728]